MPREENLQIIPGKQETAKKTPEKQNVDVQLKKEESSEIQDNLMVVKNSIEKICQTYKEFITLPDEELTRVDKEFFCFPQSRKSSSCYNSMFIEKSTEEIDIQEIIRDFDNNVSEG